MVNDISTHLISSITVFRHLPEILVRRKFARDPISVLVGKAASLGGTLVLVPPRPIEDPRDRTPETCLCMRGLCPFPPSQVR